MRRLNLHYRTIKVELLNHYRKEETLIVGDRLYTDILCGYHAGVETVLVLSGEATEEEAKAYEHQPDLRDVIR